MKPGRNDPCPCGSGRKSKNCCGSNSAAALVTLFNAGRFAAVEPLARELVGRDPASGIGWKILGVSLLMQRKDALPALQRATELLCEDAEAHCNLGSAWVELGQFDEAVKSCTRAVEIDPRLAEAHNNLGNGLRGLGQWEAAASSYRRAIDLKPRFAKAHNNHGIAMLGLGRPTEAIVSYHRALEFEPGFAEAHHNLANALRGLGEREAAVASYERALAIRPRLAEAHGGLGMVLQELGRLDEAAARYRRALELKPEAEVHRRLGTALLHLGRPAEALDSYQCALDLEPTASRHNDLGNALFELDRLDDAEASYREALRIDSHSAQAHCNLGCVLRLRRCTDQAQASCRNALGIEPRLAAAHGLWGDLCADSGRFAEAEESFRRAAAIEPDLPSPWAGIASVRRMTCDDAGWLTQALRVAALPLPPRHRVDLTHALGKYFDDMQDYPQAFAHYQRAKELARSYRPKYDRQLLTRQIGQLIQSYDRTWVCRKRHNPSPSSRPVFVVGMPRSGTSLAEQILASHPAIFGAGELPFWTNAMATDDSDRLTGADGDRITEQWARAYLQLLEETTVDALRVVDKMPANGLYLGMIHAALPNARIIHMRRNPIDTCLSIYSQNFRAAPSYASDLDDLAHFYSEHRRVLQHWRQTLPAGTLLEVPYEELVADQERWTRRMLEFIGMPWDARCLDFHRTERPVLTASRWQVRQTMSSSSTRRWRNYYEFAAPLLRLSSEEEATWC
jgi:tetratricopeptide (TPR) repeat protein